MKLHGLAMLIAAIPLACLGDDPKTVKVDVIVLVDHIKLAPAGDPPTFSALRVDRVVNPATGKPYDISNKELGCDPADLRRTFRLNAAEVLLGEPVLVEFRVELAGPGEWGEWMGGNYRGLGRDGNFFFLMRHRGGAWVPDIFEGHAMSSFGGIGGPHTVERGQPMSHWIAVQQWCAIDRPGVYDLYAFHWGRAAEVGLDPPMDVAPTDEAKKRAHVDKDGKLVDREANELPVRRLEEQLTRRFIEPGDTPLAGSIPDAVKAKLKEASHATDYAHFTLTVRQGDAQERRAMVNRWIKLADFGIGSEPTERPSAAKDAIALARQDDFLPELKRRLAGKDELDPSVVFLGLAMRDDPRAVDMLFAAGGPWAIQDMRFLRPPQVPAAIPRLIELLTNDDHTTRAVAEDVLRGWTGQAFGRAWKGYHHERPTLAEGRAMQAPYRAWWERSKATFKPRFR